MLKKNDTRVGRNRNKTCPASTKTCRVKSRGFGESRSSKTKGKAHRAGWSPERLTLAWEVDMIVAESEVKEAAAKPAGFHHILVATDFSKCSERALTQAVALAEENEAEVSLVHVLTSDWRYEMLENPPELGLEFV